MDSRTFLDVDDSILTRNLLLPENSCGDEMLMKQPDAKPFFVIQPTPGLCIKARTDTAEKVFINICTSDKIPPPDDISDTELIQIICEQNPNFVVPMSIGSERLEIDKSGSPVSTYDVVINTKYFEKCKKNRSFLLFTISVVIDGISNKFGKNISGDGYTILKNRKAMGKLQPHRIENREPRNRLQPQKQLIEEISYPARKNEKKTKVDQSEDVTDSRNYVLLKQPIEGTATHLIGLFQIPKAVTTKEVDVLMDKDRIVITIDKANLTYDLSVPYTINIADVNCFLDKDLRVLRLDMPVESVSDNIQTIGSN